MPNYNKLPFSSNKEFSFEQFSENEIKEITDAFLEKMNSGPHLSFTSFDIGREERIIAVLGSPSYIIFNPKIVFESVEDQIVLEETHSLFPYLKVKIKRPRVIRVRFQTPSGVLTTKKFDGLSAREILHQMDILDGIHFISRASFFEKEKAKKQIAKHSKKMRRMKYAD